MDDIYRELQAAIIELKTEATGIQLGTDAFSSPSFDTYLGGKIEGKTSYIQGTPQQLGILSGGLTELLGLLRAQDWVYRHAHWQVQGDNFYGDHLMFTRLYENTTSEIDTLAEKISGYLGSKVLEPIKLLNIASTWVTRWETIECPFRRSLRSEEDFQKVAKVVYNICTQAGVMTLGLDDFIQSLSGSHDSHTYLLQQKLEFKESSIGRRAMLLQAKKVASQTRTGMKRVSFDDLSAYLRVGNDMLVHKCEKDLWQLSKDAQGKDVIERLYEGDVLNY